MNLAIKEKLTPNQDSILALSALKNGRGKKII